MRAPTPGALPQLDVGPAVVAWVRATRQVLDALEQLFAGNEAAGLPALRLVVRSLEDGDGG